MLKIVTTINNRRTAIFAFERVNLERLLADQPVLIDMQALVQHADYDEPIQDIVIMAEETMQDVHRRLTNVGLPLPAFESLGPADPPLIRKNVR